MLAGCAEWRFSVHSATQTTRGSGIPTKTPGSAQNAETVCRDRVEHAPPKARVELEHENRGRLMRAARDDVPYYAGLGSRSRKGNGGNARGCER